MFRSADIIPAGSPLGKCAILFRPVQTQNGAGNLPQGHLRNVADGCAQDGQGFRGIEFTDVLKIAFNEIETRVTTAPGQEHKADAVFQQAAETRFHIRIIQRFQGTARFDGA